MSLEKQTPTDSPDSRKKRTELDAKKLKQASESDKQLDECRKQYNVKENKAGRYVLINDINDVEYRPESVGEAIGYLPFLEALLKEVKDTDEWTWDSSLEDYKERAILQKSAAAIQNNLKSLSKTLDAAKDKNSKAYKALHRRYLEISQRLVEITANVDTENESVQVRNPKLSAVQVQETMRHMSVEQAINWAKEMMVKIDMNDWQSAGLKETYGVLTQACTRALGEKIKEEKAQSMNDPALARKHVRHCMELAKLFTDRGTSIDSNLVNIDFAIGMARDAMGFGELAMQYMEQSLKRENPLKKYVDERKEAVIKKVEHLPRQTRENPQVQSMVATLEGTPDTIQGLSEQYTILRNLEVLFDGGDAPNLEQELNEKLNTFMEQSFEQFENFLDGDLTGAASLDQINSALGSPGLSPHQVEAWKLLSDIQGYGYDIGDKSWSYIAEGAKIAAMIAAGVAIGIATMGFGVVGAALIGGAGMTVTGAVINQQGFDDLDDALGTYGKDMAINTATMGAARYLAAGRAAYQLNRTGLLKDAGGMRELFKIASQKGGLKLINSFDDGLNIGTRLAGAGVEGVGDVGIGTLIDVTAGGEFLDSLKNNAMFFGLAGAEFAGPAMRSLRRLPAEDLHGVAQLVNRANLEKTNLFEKCRGFEVDPKNLLEADNPTSLLKKAGVSADRMDEILATVTGMKKIKTEFADTMQKLKKQGEALKAESSKSPHKSERPEAGMHRIPFKLGEEVRVQRTKGALEEGWVVVSINDATGRYRVTNKSATIVKDISPKDLENWNPPKLRVPRPKASPEAGIDPRAFRRGEPVRVKRDKGRGRMEDDWFVVGMDAETGRYKVMNESRTAQKKVLPEDLAKWNSPRKPLTKAKGSKGPENPRARKGRKERYRNAQKDIDPLAMKERIPALEKILIGEKIVDDKFKFSQKQIDGITRAHNIPKEGSAEVWLKKKQVELMKTFKDHPQQKEITEACLRTGTAGNLIPPPPPPRRRSAKIGQTSAEQQSKSAKRPAAKLSPEEAEMMQYATDYGNLTPSQQQLPSDLANQLQKYRQDGVFEFQCYNDYKRTGYPKGATRDDRNTLKGYTLHDGAPGLYQKNSRMQSEGSNFLEHKENIGVTEALIYRPLYRNTVVGKKRYTIEEPGMLWGTKKIEKQRDVRKMLPAPYNQALKGNTSSEQTVRISYHLSNDQSYKTNVVEDMPGGRKSRERHDRSGQAQPEGNYQNHMNDISRARQIAEKTGNRGRPGNQVVISIVLPESQARNLYQYFQQNPGMVRPFFVNGSMGLQTFHNPPPFRQWDSANPHRKMLFRDFNGISEYNDQIIKASQEGRKNAPSRTSPLGDPQSVPQQNTASAKKSAQWEIPPPPPPRSAASQARKGRKERYRNAQKDIDPLVMRERIPTLENILIGEKIVNDKFKFSQKQIDGITKAHDIPKEGSAEVWLKKKRVELMKTFKGHPQQKEITEACLRTGTAGKLVELPPSRPTLGDKPANEADMARLKNMIQGIVGEEGDPAGRETRFWDLIVKLPLSLKEKAFSLYDAAEEALEGKRIKGQKEKVSKQVRTPRSINEALRKSRELRGEIEEDRLAKIFEVRREKRLLRDKEGDTEYVSNLARRRGELEKWEDRLTDLQQEKADLEKLIPLQETEIPKRKERLDEAKEKGENTDIEEFQLNTMTQELKENRIGKGEVDEQIKIELENPPWKEWESKDN